jgi:hypothetical protein
MTILNLELIRYSKDEADCAKVACLRNNLFPAIIKSYLLAYVFQIVASYTTFMTKHQAIRCSSTYFLYLLTASVVFKSNYTDLLKYT